MLMNLEMGGVFDQQVRCELRVHCGPRYNAFSPEADGRELPGKFFLRDAWKLMRRIKEEEIPHSDPRMDPSGYLQWDGIE
jgi:hypothetical protein